MINKDIKSQVEKIESEVEKLFMMSEQENTEELCITIQIKLRKYLKINEE